ncbi:MAG: DUF4327 family protein [Calothrix sp. C42_A2020_038]|nr:DUF4327 family protein [Calothrix sp. C42_A2020_038]
MSTAVKYDIEVIKEEARELVNKGVIQRNEPIYVLCKFIPDREWVCVELELEKNEFLLRDKIIDLLTNEKWSED